MPLEALLYVAFVWGGCGAAFLKRTYRVAVVHANGAAVLADGVRLSRNGETRSTSPNGACIRRIGCIAIDPRIDCGR